MQPAHRSISVFLLAGALSLSGVALSGCSPSGQAPGSGEQAPGSSQDRRGAQILTNLKLKLPQLADANPVMGPIEPSGVRGLDEGSFRVGAQTYPFLVTADNTKLYLVRADPIDVSLGEEDVARELARLEEEKARKAAELRDKLEDAIAGLPARGNPEGAITIVEFSDFQCPYCARGANTVEQILDKYGADVKFVFKHFPLSFHPWAKPAAIAANCAGKQSNDAFWLLHDKFFENQRSLTVGNVVSNSKNYLEGSEIDLGLWEECAGDPDSEAYIAEANAVDADMALGQEMGVSGTPGFFVNGVFLNGAQPLAAFEPLIEKARAGES